MKPDLHGTFSFASNRKFYCLTAILLLAAAALLFAPAAEKGAVAGAAAAAQTGEETPDPKRARADMLAVALDLRAAADYAVFAARGVRDGSAQIKGKTFDAARAGGETGTRARNDLARAFAAINQLPCDELNSELAGGAFQAGVYCTSSARLTEELILDGDNNSQAIFVFRVSGALTANSGLKISLRSEARAENVYFVTEDSATIETATEFKGNILARNSVEIGARATVAGKILSLAGEVKLSEASRVGGGTGILQICKGTPPGEPMTGAGNLFNRLFRFRIGTTIYEVQTGQCSNPIELPAGSVVIEELLDGRTLPTGTFSGRFKLIDVNSPTPGALGAVNLFTRTANVFIREGDANNLTVVNFVNTFAVMAVVEICKRAAAPTTNPAIDDRDVTGFFDFSIDAAANTIFAIPAGQCSGPIQVNVPRAPEPFLSLAIIRISELSEPGYTLESASAFPADRFVSLTRNKRISFADNRTELDNPRGGYVTVGVLEGGASSKTTVDFFNRSNPAQIKVCKIAGPGISEGTRFRFNVSGLAPASSDTILPGVQISRTVEVAAGAAATGGNCATADGTFIVGSNVTVTEELPPLDPVDTSNGGSIRVSRIQASSQQGLTADLNNRTVTLAARIQETRVEFVNFVLRPTLLKICKIAGPGIAVGTPFTFDVTIVNDAGGLFPNLTVPPFTVQAGPAAQGGFCAFANGPYPATGTPPIGTFRDGSTVVVSERPISPTITVTSITSPTGTPTVDLPNRRATLTLGFPNGFNELNFTNSNIADLISRPPFDFDGDSRTDFSIRRSNGTIVWIRSSTSVPQSVNFGLPTDRLVPADYDGDGKTDFAVYRDGTWHILQSSNGQYRGVQFGLADDIPQPGDYDGDGTDDLAVFRPSNGFWYISRSRDGFLAAQFGTSGDKPILGDFDGDRKNDLAVYRPSNGTWYILQSRDGFRAVQFGIASDKLVAADYDGDGKTDLGVYRNGAWYLLRSTAGFGYVQFGLATDTPLLGDFDGDGRNDVAVYRFGVNDIGVPSGAWYLQLSSGSFQTFYFGNAPDDFPIPATYVR